MTVFPTVNSVGSTTGGRYCSEYNLSKFLIQAGGDGYFISGCTAPSASSAGDHTIKITSGEALLDGYIVRMTTQQVIPISTGSTGPNYLYLKHTLDGSGNVSATSWKQTTSTTWPADSLYWGNVIVASTAISGTSFANRSWRTPTFGSSWSNYGGAHDVAGYKKIASNKVELKGSVKNNTTIGGTLVFQLPSDFRPSYKRPFVIDVNCGAGLIEVDSTGGVVHSVGNCSVIVTLNGVSFDIKS